MNYGSLNLQDSVIITESVQYRSMANRIVNLVEVSRRPGSKFLSTEFSSKTISMSGHIISPTASGLLGLVDNIHRYLALTEQSLVITDGRAYTATCSKIEIPELKYTQSVVPFSFEFITASPFSVASLRTSGFTLVSGVYTLDITTTISGSAFAEPSVRFNTLSGAGDSGVTMFKVTQNTNGDFVTVSGTFSRSVETVFNNQDATVTVSGLLNDYTGGFSRWGVGSNSITVTVSGINDLGVTGSLEYQPRYFQ